MDYYIQNGVCFSTLVGAPEGPEIIRWTTLGNGDLQQSYLLDTAEGTLIVDPVLPKSSEGLRALTHRAGKVTAIVSLSPLHERDIAEASKHYGAPVYGPRSPEKTTRYGRKLDVGYEDGELPPGGVLAIYSGDWSGEMWLYWPTPGGLRVLINADTIYGENKPCGFGGRAASYWMQEGGIRLCSMGMTKLKELRRHYDGLGPLDIDLILNGHNPLPLDDDPKAAIAEVLSKGTYEVHPGGICTFMYMDF
jgi:hypothetical protein